MKKRGFSLSEVLIALVLMISISLALLKQQWQITRLRVHIEQQMRQLLEKSNAYEQGCMPSSKECGMSLLELMIALALSLSMTTLLMQEYMQIQQHYQLTEKIIDESTQLQFTLDFIRDRGHQAGFTPCVALHQLIAIDHRSDNTLKAIQFDSKHASKITLSHMDSRYHRIETIEDNKRIFITKSFNLYSDYPLMIADCEHAEVFEKYRLWSQGNQWVIELAQALRFAYHAPMYIGEWVEESFWVAKSKTQSSAALFYQYHSHTDELMPKVANLDWHFEDHQNGKTLHLNMQRNQITSVPLDIRMHHL